MYRTYSKYCFKYIPRIFLKLFVTKAQTTVFFIDFQYLNFNVSTNLSKF